mmetsp:Transcript_29149/g.65987  ORF Transcript_29149/g.65987 Transcript_29149/m.65987 type:complete len:178 (-) Transcript_29149:37-570(-)
MTAVPVHLHASPLQQRLRRERRSALGRLAVVACLAAAGLSVTAGSAFVPLPGAVEGQQQLPRRALLALPLLWPAAGASAREPAMPGNSGPQPRGGPRTPGGKAPKEIESPGEGDVWEAIDVGESSIVDPADAKYKQLRIIADMEKQKKRNDDYDNMSREEKAEKMCELLGRGCQGTN